MEVLRDDYGEYEYKRQNMQDQEPDRGGCLAMSVLFVVVMLALMCWGCWELTH